MYVQPNHFAVQQKLTHHCELTTLQEHCFFFLSNICSKQETQHRKAQKDNYSYLHRQEKVITYTLWLHPVAFSTQPHIKEGNTETALEGGEDVYQGSTGVVGVPG